MYISKIVAVGILTKRSVLSTTIHHSPSSTTVNPIKNNYAPILFKRIKNRDKKWKLSECDFV